MKIVAALGIRRQPGFLYFVKGTDVLRVQMKRGGKYRRRAPQLVAHGSFQRVRGCLYFVNGKGDVAQTRQRTAKPATRSRPKPATRPRPKGEPLGPGGVVYKLGIQRVAGYLYFVEGTNVMRMSMTAAPTPSEVELLARCRFQREEGYLYYIDRNGDIACAPRLIGP